MITPIAYEQIFPAWKNDLWPGRVDVEPVSWMKFLEGYQDNSSMTPVYWGYVVDELILGVNSGHMCLDGSYRSRGLWVHESQRGKGIGRQLLLATIEQAQVEKASMIWSYPRQSSWKTYQSCGFELASGWIETPTAINAYCKMPL